MSRYLAWWKHRLLRKSSYQECCFVLCCIHVEKFTQPLPQHDEPQLHDYGDSNLPKPRKSPMHSDIFSKTATGLLTSMSSCNANEHEFYSTRSKCLLQYLLTRKLQTRNQFKKLRRNQKSGLSNDCRKRVRWLASIKTRTDGRRSSDKERSNIEEQLPWVAVQVDHGHGLAWYEENIGTEMLRGALLLLLWRNTKVLWITYVYWFRYDLGILWRVIISEIAVAPVFPLLSMFSWSSAILCRGWKLIVREQRTMLKSFLHKRWLQSQISRFSKYSSILGSFAINRILSIHCSAEIRVQMLIRETARKWRDLRVERNCVLL